MLPTITASKTETYAFPRWSVGTRKKVRQIEKETFNIYTTIYRPLRSRRKER